MTIDVYGVKITFCSTHHVNHSIGATFIWPNGEKTYGEYSSIKDAINNAIAERGNRS